MKLERVDPKTLLADECNVRTHPARNLRAIRSSLETFGQQKPIIVDRNGVIIAGHGLATAAAELGLPFVLIIRSDLEGDARAAYAIADNRTAELASWSKGLAAALEELKAEDADLFLAAGFNDRELKAMLAGEAAQDAGKDYDESIADSVEFHECRECSHRWPK